jgi:hypothetical protein
VTRISYFFTLGEGLINSLATAPSTSGPVRHSGNDTDSQRDKSKNSVQPVRLLDSSIVPRLPAASRYAWNNSSRMYVRCLLASDSGPTPCHTRAIMLLKMPRREPPGKQIPSYFVPAGSAAHARGDTARPSLDHNPLSSFRRRPSLTPIPGGAVILLTPPPSATPAAQAE